MNTVRKLAASPLLWVLVVALVARLSAAAWWQSRLPPGARFAFGDSESYWVLGQAIARGAPYRYDSPDRRVFRTPGYPLVLAGMFVVAGDRASVPLARGIGAVLGTLTVGGVYVLGARLFDRRSGLVAAAVAALYPGAIGMSVFVLSEAAFCPVMMAQLAVLAAAWKCPTFKNSLALALLGGCLAGAATLIRPSWLLFTPLAVGLAVLAGRPLLARRIAFGAAVMFGLALTMAPWWIRNVQAIGHFVPTTLEVGASLYDGLNPQADGSSNMAFVPGFTERERAAGIGGDNFEYELDQSFRHAAIDWARDNPGSVLRLAAIKAGRLWNIWPNEPDFRGVAMRLAVLVSYVPLMLMALVGAWRFSRRGWPYVLCWLPAMYFTCVHMVFVSSIRYREPAMLPLIVLAAAAVFYSCAAEPRQPFATV